MTKEVGSFLRLSRYPDTEPWWGKRACYRFDDPFGEFGVTYVAEDLEVAFAETIIHETACYEDGAWIVPREQIDGRWIVRYIPAKPLILLDLTGVHLKRLGLNNDICSDNDYAFTQALSRAVHHHIPEADGIYYLSRQLNTKFAAALFERSKVECSGERIKFDAHPGYPDLLRVFNVEII